VTVKRPGIFLVASVVLLTLLPWNTAEAQTFKNCAAVKAKYPNGVAINFAVMGTSGAEINRVIYLRNQRLDRDKDGLICEDELKRNSTTTTTTTLSTGQFAGRYGSSLVSVLCDSSRSQGSGVVVPIQLVDQEILNIRRDFRPLRTQ